MCLSSTTGDITFELTAGNGENKFSIEGTTGWIILAKSLDRETTDSYTLTVTAKDHGVSSLSADVTVTFNVTDINDNEPYCTSTVYMASVNEDESATYSVQTIDCQDDDDGVNADLVYTITSGNTGTAFSIDSTTGEVEVAAALDAETTDYYEIQVTVTDQGTSSLSTVVTLVVNIIEVNENAPVFSPSANYTVDMNEVEAPGTYVTNVTAYDLDLGVSGQVVYSISGGNTDSVFHIDSVDGYIYLQGYLDRETYPDYTLLVEATDEGTIPLTSTATVYVTVVDYNDNEPACQSDPYVSSIAESVGIGTTVDTVSCTDDDINSNEQIDYYITAGNAEGKFAIDTTSGIITTIATVDYETTQRYDLDVEAVDQGVLSLTGTSKVSVFITPVNDHDPDIIEPLSGYEVNITENITRGDIIIEIEATDDDLDIHGVIRYSIVAGNSQNAFAIGSSSGNISVVKNLDREAVSSYTLTVRATDSLPANGDERSADTTVTITVTDINDNFPIFVPAVYSTSVYETAGIGATIDQVTTTDDDTGTNAVHDYLIVDGNTDDSFYMDGTDVVLNNSMNYEVIDYYKLKVMASDQGDPELTSYAYVIINILPFNEFTPVLSENSSTVTLKENIAVGSAIYNANATDLDAGEHGDLLYAIAEGNPDDSTFLIDSDTGLVTVGRSLDYDTAPSTYTLNITVIDNIYENDNLLDSLTLNIILEDVNDNTPIFTQNQYSIFIDEDIGLSTSVGEVSATDADSGLNAELFYSISSGDGFSEFAVNSSTGVISTTASHTIDYEDKTSYSLLVKVEDLGVPSRSSFCVMKISINDINDNDPVFDVDDFTVSVDEGEATNYFTTSVRATDRDSALNAQLTFSFHASSDSNSHFIFTSSDANTIGVTTNAVLDREYIDR